MVRLARAPRHKPAMRRRRYRDHRIAPIPTRCARGRPVVEPGQDRGKRGTAPVERGGGGRFRSGWKLGHGSSDGEGRCLGSGASAAAEGRLASGSSQKDARPFPNTANINNVIVFLEIAFADSHATPKTVSPQFSALDPPPDGLGADFQPVRDGRDRRQCQSKSA